ncbi:MAG: DUF1015 family protein [Elusimicrobia bacterium]|nr:DUF1015 family protein [Elusimicrobiota bacterium]
MADSQPSASLLNKIFAVARARQTMPHKATYFYPKVYSGLVINKIGEAMGSGLHLSLPAGK